MGETTAIEWCDATFNAWRGCEKVSPGCKNCYAAARDVRFEGGKHWGKTAPRAHAAASKWREPLKWNREALAAGVRRRVFTNSLADVFEERADLVDARRRLFELIANTPMLDWLLLTKRPENITRLMPSFTLYGDVGPWPNVWLGTTVEDQARADQRIPHLLRVPAAVRFLSMEPLLERVDLTRFGAAFHGIHWAIIGGESGPGARPFHVTWARELLEQLRFAKVAAFVKQLGKVPLMDETEWRVGNERGVRLLKASNRSKSGEGMVPILLRDTKGGNWDEWPADLRVREFPR